MTPAHQQAIRELLARAMAAGPDTARGRDDLLRSLRDMTAALGQAMDALDRKLAPKVFIAQGMPIPRCSLCMCEAAWCVSLDRVIFFECRDCRGSFGRSDDNLRLRVPVERVPRDDLAP